MWLLLALVIHAELFLLVGALLYFQAPRDADMIALAERQRREAAESVEISTLDDEAARRILAELDKAEEEAKAEALKKEIESPEAPGQTVQIAKPVEEKRPENARFAAEYDSTVEKETRKYGRFDEKARQGSARGEAAESTPASAPPSPPGAAATAPGEALAMKRPGAPGRGAEARAVAEEEPQPTSEQAPADRPSAETMPIDPEGWRSLGGRLTLRPPLTGGGQDGENGSPARQAPGAGGPLAPSQQQIARAVGGGTEDHLSDIDEGDETSLNAKKWKHASFFNRVKAQVRQHWNPDAVYQRRDPTGSIYGSKDRYTLLRVQIKPDGSLANVALEQPSGVEFLDDEAIEAFKQAQPFPNPPRQLVEGSSGLINFRFGFYFELSGAPKMKVFRYNSM